MFFIHLQAVLRPVWYFFNVLRHSQVFQKFKRSACSFRMLDSLMGRSATATRDVPHRQKGKKAFNLQPQHIHRRPGSMLVGVWYFCGEKMRKVSRRERRHILFCFVIPCKRAFYFPSPFQNNNCVPLKGSNHYCTVAGLVFCCFFLFAF